jgi:hypothetical protein
MRVTPGVWGRVGVLLALLASAGPVGRDQTRPLSAMPGELEFLQRHWRRPIPPQGETPARFSPIERSLAPESCGTCHPAQFGDWKTSVHARAMGPGISGQLVEMTGSDPDSARLCLSCHAPLAEQQPPIPAARRTVTSPGFDAALQSQGLVCAACHVRQHERFGPPRCDGSTASQAPGQSLPHNGATRTSAFLRSEFCSSCHQFPPDGFALNGKLLENTYEEWKRSPAARQGLQCQDCHMPDRQHLWRGIHDPDMVKSGIEIALRTDRPRYRPGQQVQSTLIISSTRVGHHFPTYVTPRVVARAELLDAGGQPIRGSLRERAIGREVTLDPSREIADTRIPAGGRMTWSYRHRLDRPGLRLRFSVTVFPDHFYTRFFQSLLSTGAGGRPCWSGSCSGAGRAPAPGVRWSGGPRDRPSLPVDSLEDS